MDEVTVVLRGYVSGELDLDTAARRLLALWQDPVSGGWGFYLHDEELSAADRTRAHALESRFHELVANVIPKPKAGGTA